ncbi:hypothetical protein [Pseudofrankia sp. DC12]|nr:hypothetical protein [Pseudofrankia sp. DC12]
MPPTFSEPQWPLIMIDIATFMNQQDLGRHQTVVAEPVKRFETT